VRIVVYGAGALGSAFGGMQAMAGNDVVLVGRPPHTSAIQSGGLFLAGLWGEHHVTNLITAEGPEAVREAQVVFLTTKAFDTATAMDEIAPHLPRDADVVSLQNGIGNHEIIARAVGLDRVIAGMVIIGFEIARPGAVTVTVAADSVKLGRLDGSVDERLEAIVKALAEAGIPTRAVTDIARHVWAKALYNCALNPLGAILGVHYGALLADEAWAVIESVVREAFAVARAAGKDLFWNEPDEYLEHLRNRQIPATFHHRPSMLHDIEHNRRTEIDFLNGAIASLGREHGVPTPVNSTLTRIVHARSTRRT